MIEEAREHLVDAVEDGRQRGLSVEDAGEKRSRRFGAPEVVAAHVVPEGTHVAWDRPVFETVWRRKWWILAPTVVTALVTSVMSYYFLPTRYRSESVILVVSPRVPAEYARPTVTDTAGKRFEQIRQQILSLTRLERIIRDMGLYQVELERAVLGDVVQLMRRDITINLLTSDPQRGDLSAFSVSFEAADPRLAQRVTERLSSLMIRSPFATGRC